MFVCERCDKYKDIPIINQETKNGLSIYLQMNHGIWEALEKERFEEYKSKEKVLRNKSMPDNTKKENVTAQKERALGVFVSTANA